MAQGLLCLLLKVRGSRLEVLEGAAGLAIVVLFTFFLGVTFFHHEFRAALARRLFKAANHLVYLFSQAEIPRERFEDFDAQIREGLSHIRRKGWKLGAAVAYICGDWFFTLLVLHYTFLAVGRGVAVGDLIAAFGVGSLATVIPFLPAGMGAMEGTMAAAFDRLGIPFEQALAACLLYRLLYYLLPGLLALFVYWGLQISEPKPPRFGAGPKSES